MKDQTLTIPDQEIQGEIIEGTRIDYPIPITLELENVEIAANNLAASNKIIFFAIAPLLGEIKEEAMTYDIIMNASSEADNQDKEILMPVYD